MKVYLVGGAVRDHLLGIHTQDRDWVVVGATVEEMLALGFKPIGKDFPVFIHPETREQYALARSEKKVGKGYHGFVFYTDPSITLEQDLLRRDLTINAMAMDEEGHIIDPYHGSQDLERGILKHVSPAFKEDPIRVLRLSRFIAKFGFEVDGETIHLVHGMVASGELQGLVRDRVWLEFSKGLLAKYVYQMLSFLSQYGILNILFPELALIFEKYTDQFRLILGCYEFETLDLSQRLAILVSFLESQAQVNSFLNTLPVPKKVFKYIVNFYLIFQTFKQCSEVNSEIILTLFEVGGAFHQYDRFMRILSLLELMLRQLTYKSNLFKYDLGLILSELRKIDSEAVIKKYPGEEITEVIRKERLKTIEALV